MSLSEDLVGTIFAIILVFVSVKMFISMLKK